MKITVWVISTCIPGENMPSLPSVFGSETIARLEFDRLMRAEWESNAPENDECTGRLPYPGDPDEAHDLMAENSEWGQWELTAHHIEVS